MATTEGKWMPAETIPHDGAFLVKNAIGQVCQCDSREEHRTIHNVVGFADWNYGEPITGWMPLPSADDAFASPAPPRSDGEAFQARVQPWMMACFGPEISADRIERNHRFLEEALELVQACGCTQNEAHQLVDYVFDRDQGDINQEVGGVMVTLAALCLASGFDMHSAGETELARVWTKIEKIRAKQAAKPRHSPLPEPSRSGLVEELVSALEPFAAAATVVDDDALPDDHIIAAAKRGESFLYRLSAGDFRAARSVLARAKGDDPAGGTVRKP